ncbi:rhodanese-like domain-containing protein [Bizionia psychrotolerans]|uniref:rhodanese-like domain-containing protein n=1 Tax=Bizionia psychrotolerans TaxID=1492901 RepID=UPI000651C4C4|nr:rhodanese-like domain-containing protein [Bizionia psychrotolerans]
MKNIFGFSLLFILLTFSSCQESSKNNDIIQVVTAEEMQALLDLDDVQLIDVRTPEEYAEGYIDNFQNIDFLSATFEEDILKLDKNKPVILYCRSGGRSAKCAKKMLEAGFVKIYDLQGGISKWEHDGHEIVMTN